MTIYRIDVEVVAPVKPTEDPEYVAQAITELFPNVEITHTTGELIGRTHTVDRFVDLLAKQRIQDTARTILHESIDGDSIVFSLNKQAAFVGVVNFAIDDPPELGDIVVSIRVEQPDPHHFVEAIVNPNAD